MMTLTYVFQVKLLIFISEDVTVIYRSSCPRTHYVTQASPKIKAIILVPECEYGRYLWLQLYLFSLC